jgi:hypothetical protein
VAVVVTDDGRAADAARTRAHMGVADGRPRLLVTACGIEERHGPSAAMIGIERVPGRGETIDAFELSLIVPLPGQERNSVVFEERDGSNITEFTAKSVELVVAGKRVFRFGELKMTAFVTNARLAFACSKFNDSERLLRPGEWPEQLLKVGMKTFAAVRRHKRMLVGQVRYPWIASVGGTDNVGWSGKRRLQIMGGLNEDRPVELVLELPKDVNATQVAAEIARRAAAYRLASETDLTDEQRTALTALAAAAAQTSEEKNKIAPHNFPDFWCVGEESARFVPVTAVLATSEPVDDSPPFSPPPPS